MNHAPDYDEPVDRLAYDFGLNRRSFVQWLGAGLLIAVSPAPVLAQDNRRREGGRMRPLDARLHIGKDGVITVLTGKVEAGQGARAELTQAAAEELRVPAGQVQLVMADTGVVPDDGLTAGSRSTPSTVPAIRQPPPPPPGPRRPPPQAPPTPRPAPAARELLIEFAARQWSVERNAIEVRDGQAVHAATKRELAYADLARSDDAAKLLQQNVPADVTL